MKKQVVSEIDIVIGTIDSPKGFEIDRENKKRYNNFYKPKKNK